jgi:hypothetical protein
MQIRSVSRRNRFRFPAYVALFALAMTQLPLAWSQDAVNSSFTDTAPNPQADYSAGHGSIGLEFQHTYYHGDFDGPAGKDSGDVSFFVQELRASYFVADGWEVAIGLPYVESAYSGKYASMFAHPVLSCLTPAGPTPACRPTLLDDGNYHGTFQDWNAGVRYHFDYAGYQLAPKIDLVVPSHNYQYYGAASFGERNTQVGVGMQLSRQFDFSNFYYDAQYEYYFNTPHIGYNNNYSSLVVDVGYFISPRLSAKILGDLKIGNGITDQEIGGPPALDPIWLNHDRIRLQDHGLVGAAINYALTDKYNIQATLEHAVWGRSNGDLKYGLDFQISRSF